MSLPAPAAPLRVVLADDEPLVRAGLAGILGTDSSLQVVAQGSSGEEALAAVRAHRPDVVLLDVRMGPTSGLEALAEIRRGAGPLPCLMVTTFGEDEYVAEAVRLGADGFVLKSGDPRELLLAVHAVASGGAFFSPAVSRRLLQNGLGTRFVARQDARERFERLTRREQEVLSLVGGGLSNAEIAASLHLAEGTVKVHVTSILRTTGARNRVEAALIAAHADAAG
ncbi:response regulator [Promicromonospora thailandica]|uniref:Two component transcriptional regulator, LuxR family n=1 Tax=Promicromonospora thailandica TaxID=765201 RepID=A0A9X2G613_9MICO|nr:response regulator transcription factor [Promicromonospora thailandica]MCP2266203.1 two component transcriptional regulator, LuxR family [Promicromonospora thailandica]BFF20684.1 response regulator transcription factor [Promicromonospora thailandica]